MIAYVNFNLAASSSGNQITNIQQYYQNFKKYYEYKLGKDSNLKKMDSEYDPLNPSSTDKAEYRQKVAKVYEDMVSETGLNIGYFYRYLFNTIKFVVEEADNNKDEISPKRYLNILQSQLSNEELCLLFYNSISSYGQNKDGHLEFKKMLDRLQFLENIDSSFLLNRNQYAFYPHTIFKFLNDKEIKNVSPTLI